ncbi:hypothetical protein [Kingella kingae]
MDVFPENPADYQFIHPVGAVLVGYQSSRLTILVTRALDWRAA